MILKERVGEVHGPGLVWGWCGTRVGRSGSGKDGIGLSKEDSKRGRRQVMSSKVGGLGLSILWMFPFLFD